MTRPATPGECARAIAAARTIPELEAAGELVADLALCDRHSYWELTDRYWRRQGELLARVTLTEVGPQGAKEANKVGGGWVRAQPVSRRASM